MRSNRATILLIAIIAVVMIAIVGLGTTSSRSSRFSSIDPVTGIGGPYLPGTSQRRVTTTVRDGPPEVPWNVPVLLAEVAWEIELPGTLGYSAPVVVGDLILLSDDDGNMLAYDAPTRALLWTAPLGRAGFAQVPQVIPAGPDTLIVKPAQAVETATGKQRWNRNTGFSLTSAADASHVVINDGRVITCVDPSTGATMWEIPAGPSGAPAEIEGMFNPGGITIVGDVAVLQGPHNLRAVDLATGAERWSTDLATNQRRPLAARDGGIVVSTTASVLMMLDAATGATRWSAPNAGLPNSLSALYGGGEGQHVIVDLPTGALIAIDPATGTEVWKEQVEWSGRDGESSRVMGDRIVTYPSFSATQDGGLVRRGDDGSIVGYLTFAFPRNPSPFARHRDVFVASVRTAHPTVLPMTLTAFAIP